MADAHVLAFKTAGIPGLGLPMQELDMDVCHRLYNDLPNFTSQPELQRDYVKHVAALLDIIARHKMGKHFGVHAAHRHDIIPAGTVRLETNMRTHGATWTKATAIKDLDEDKMHATFFRLVQNTFVPFEFAQGPSPIAMCNIPPQFLVEYAAYLVDNELTDLVALEVGDFAKCDEKGPNSKAELEIQWGNDEVFTMNVPVSILSEAIFELIPTGWNSYSARPGIPGPDPAPGTHYAKGATPKDTHLIVVDSSEPVTEELLFQKLAEGGFVRA